MPAIGWRAAVVAAALFGALVSAAYAADAPLTLDEAIRLAVERSRLLSAKDSAAEASREMAVAAGRLPDPVLKIGLDNLPINGPDQFSTTRDFMTQRRIGFTQDLTRADKRHLRTERYEREAEKSVAEKAAASAAIQRDTAMAWLALSYAESMATAVSEQTAQAKLEVQAAEAAYRAGRGTQADLLNARSALVTFDDRASEIRSRITDATIKLARRVGDAAQRPLADRPATTAIPLDPATLEIQLAKHPDIAVLNKQEEIGATEAKLARADKKADWSVEVAFQQRGPAYSNMVSLGVSVPLHWNQKNLQDREVASKLALVEQAKAERDDALLERVAEVRALINEWHTSRERRIRYEGDLVPLAQSRAAALLAAYRGGKAALADVLAARNAELTVRLEALQLEAQGAQLWAQLNYVFPQEGGPAPHSDARVNKDSK
ncbi:TolC family protein [Massilia sp. RP-1-19]|uniref:TolC family protein n=1 Tax=Massilia polaris TaxID=2728846 RepID=A0A848HFS6_9BURK|nr:TolC family protein [Massilia polaris]NML59822.1 TolC family protein [Massilia polaris]